MNARWTTLVAATLAGCGARSLPPAPPPPPPEPPLWVLAPHPDDEALIASRVIAQHVEQERPIVVHLMTNGDLGCERDGYQRQRETVAAMRVLGLPEERIRFLSYPDGHMDALGAVPLPPLPRRLEDGECGAGAVTYGAHGEHHLDVHTARTGEPAPYVAQSVIDDLVALLEQDRPREIYVVHPIDAHPDHAMTYVMLRRALEHARLDAIPRLHRGIVHAGGCWPNGSDPAEPCDPAGESFGTPYPPLPPPLTRYRASERIPVPDGGALGRRAIAEYRSQLHTDVENDWLGDFARADAIYWPETLVRDPLAGERLVRAPDPAIASGYVGEPSEPRIETDRTAISIDQVAPLRVSFEAAVAPNGTATVQLLAPDLASGYELAVIGDRDVELRRAGDRTIRRIRIADDGARHATHRWELRVDVRSDDVAEGELPIAEIELRRDGALLAVFVDAQPFLEGALASTRTVDATIGSLNIRAESRALPARPRPAPIPLETPPVDTAGATGAAPPVAASSE